MCASACLGGRPLGVGALFGRDPLDVGRAFVGGGLVGGASGQLVAVVGRGMPGRLPGNRRTVAPLFGGFRVGGFRVGGCSVGR